MRNSIKYSLIFSFALYLVVNTFILLREQYYKHQLEAYDLNKSGFFEENERTKNQQIALKKVSNDSAQTLAPITTIPLITIPGLIVWGILRLRRRKRSPKYLKS
ncbi:hypothetical protein SAMN05444483_104205 [Salegentibacter echinorum]|uniref:Uncharacterized protein n=1 Tax=Salegentibacter echinorum TaxID=1073325 RepID=A0A1M5GKQ6_SALEC|nr:hypothetical protein [Salegentibacter echinorum]SHG04287.1 hypothetical protein SAMN05444483_104205 [Salegentibacter echinorum]